MKQHNSEHSAQLVHILTKRLQNMHGNATSTCINIQSTFNQHHYSDYMHHTCRASAWCNRTTTCICVSSTLVGGTKSVNITQLQPHSASCTNARGVYICVIGSKAKHHQCKLITTGDDHQVRRWSICTSWWKEKHHQRKLQKGRTISGACWSGLHQQHAPLLVLTFCNLC